MLHTTIAGLRAGKRRLFGASLAIVVGVGFLAATLVMGDTLNSGFGAIFVQANAGSDVIVRSANVVGSGEDELRDRLDGHIATPLKGLPGVASVAAEINGTAQLVGADGEPLGGQGPPTLAGNWVGDRQINPYRITTGRPPRAIGEVVIDAGSAADGKLHVGSRTTVRTPEPVAVEVVGIARFGKRSSMGGSTFVAFSEQQARTLFAGPGQVTDLLVHGDGTYTPAELKASFVRLLPSRVQAITGAELTAEQRDAINGDFLGFVRTFLVAFALVALVVATFSIYNTFSILVAQRDRESALLRAVGASRRQVLTSVALEALVIGVVASALGLAAGIGLGFGLKALLAGFGLELEGGGLVVSAGALGMAFIVGVVVTFAASILPAVRASRIAPIQALRAAETEVASISRIRVTLGALAGLSGLGGVVAAGSVHGGAMSMAGLGGLALLAATLLLGPSLARAGARTGGAPIARFRGQPGKLARLNAMRNPRRTSGSASALVIGTVVVALFATLGSSIQHSIDQTVKRSFGGDLVVTADGFSGSGISPQVAPAIADLPEVETSVGVANATVTVRGADVYPSVAEPRSLAALVDLDLRAGSLADLKAGQVAISRHYAVDHHLSLGGVVPMRFVDGQREDLRVGAIYGSRDLFGNIIVTPQDWAPHTQQPGDVAVLVGLRHGVSLDEGRRAVEGVTRLHGSPSVQDRDEYIASTAGGINQLLVLVYGLLGLAVLIALLGIANTLSLSIHERRRELGLLRAVGLTRAGVRSTVRWESVITALVGTIVGVALGTFLGWGMTRAIAAQEGFVSFQAPMTTLAIVVVLAAAAGVLAAVLPARRAARLDVLAAIAGR